MSEMQPLTEEEQLAVWRTYYPDPKKKLPGNNLPQDGKCNSRLLNKDIKALDLVRFCNRSAGYGTDHLGIGTCKSHLGTSINHVRSAAREMVKRDLDQLSLTLGEAPALGPPEIEFALLAAKAKQWSLLIEKKMDKLNGEWSTFDRAGMEHARVVLEVMERAWDRCQRFYEFAMKHQLDQRVVALEEHQVGAYAGATMETLLDPELKLSEFQIRRFREKFAERISILGPSMVPSWKRGLQIIDVESDEL